MFGNSQEFTQLGTFTKDNRTAEYYRPDAVGTQPMGVGAGQQESMELLQRPGGGQKQSFLQMEVLGDADFPPTTQQESFNHE